MPTISAGSSQTFTAGVKDQLFTLTANGGALGTVTGSATASFGPGAERRSFGPFAVGQAITVTVQAGSVIVEYGDATPENEGTVGSVLNGVQTAAGASGVAGANSSNELVMLDGSLRITTPAYTWATLPAASAYIGNALVTDVGLHGSLWRSDGSTWGLVGGSCVIAESAVAQTATTGTTSAVDRVTVAIPANLMGLNGTLEIVARWTVTNNANAKTATILFGGSTVSSLGLASNATSSLQALLSNRNSASSQIGGNNNQVMSLSSSAWNTLTVDTTTAQNLVLREQLAVGTDSIQLQSYSVRLYRA